MDRTGANPRASYKAIEDFCNMSIKRARKPNERLRTPFEVATGEAPDISACSEFIFWQKILYQSYDESFPQSHDMSEDSHKFQRTVVTPSKC